MTITNVLVYVALIGYVLFKKVQGQPVATPKRLFALPIILIVLGFGDLSHGGTLKPLEIALTVIGAIISLGLGALRGRADKLSTRDGSPFVRWGTISLALFAGNIVAKLVLDLIGVAGGGTASAAGKSLIFTLGLTLLGEATVLWMRTGGATGLLNPPRVTSGQPSTDRFVEVAPPAEPSIRYQTDDQANTPAPSRQAVAPARRAHRAFTELARWWRLATPTDRPAGREPSEQHDCGTEPRRCHPGPSRPPPRPPPP